MGDLHEVLWVLAAFIGPVFSQLLASQRVYVGEVMRRAKAISALPENQKAFSTAWPILIYMWGLYSKNWTL